MNKNKKDSSWLNSFSAGFTSREVGIAGKGKKPETVAEAKKRRDKMNKRFKDSGGTK